MDHFYSARGQRRPVPWRSVITRDPSLFSEAITVTQTDSGKPTRRGWFILPYFIHTHEHTHTYKCTLAVFYICTRANALLYFTHTYRGTVNVFYTHACMHAHMHILSSRHTCMHAHMHSGYPAMLGMEPRVLCMLSKHSVIEPWPLFYFRIKNMYVCEETI